MRGTATSSCFVDSLRLRRYYRKSQWPETCHYLDPKDNWRHCRAHILVVSNNYQPRDSVVRSSIVVGGLCLAALSYLDDNFLKEHMNKGGYWPAKPLDWGAAPNENTAEKRPDSRPPL